jgi:hypothetical protein
MLPAGSSSALDLTIYQHDSELRLPPVTPRTFRPRREVHGSHAVPDIAEADYEKLMAINLAAMSGGALKRRRDEVNAIIRDRVASLPADHPWRHVKAWRWRTASSGTALTDAGHQHQLEFRLSWYAALQF